MSLVYNGNVYHLSDYYPVASNPLNVSNLSSATFAYNDIYTFEMGDEQFTTFKHSYIHISTRSSVYYTVTIGSNEVQMTGNTTDETLDIIVNNV